MPSFPLPNGSSAYYELYGSQGIDPEKDTIVILPPTLGYTSLFEAYHQDEELREQYNIMGIEPSVCPGRTSAVEDDRYDGFVAAAEVALILNTLRIPPVHLFAPEQHAALVALCLLVAFPDRLASCTAVGVPPLHNPDDVIYWDMMEAHLNPWAPESWIEVFFEFVEYLYEADRGGLPDDMLDKLMDCDARMCMYRPASMLQWWGMCMERDIISDMGLPYIQNNLFFIQNITPEVDLAKQSSEEINQSKVTAASVEDAPLGLALAQPSKVLPLFKSYLKKQPKHIVFVPTDFEAVHQRLGSILSDHKGGASSSWCAGKDATNPVSFSILSPPTIKRMRHHLDRIRALQEASKGKQCALRFGQGAPAWDVNSVDELSARWRGRHDDDAPSRTDLSSAIAAHTSVTTVSQEL